MAQPRIFISYSHNDGEWLRRLQTHLGVFRQEGLVSAWSDETLRPGDDWPHEIRAALDTSDIVVLLISANFLNSDFIMQKEMPVFLERQRVGNLKKILPLIVKPCEWRLSRYLKDIEVRPKHRDSVMRGSEADQEADLADLVAEIAKLLAAPTPAAQSEPIAPAQSEDRDQAPRSPSESDYVILEVSLAHREWDRYTVDLNLTHSGESEPHRTLSHCAAFDLPQLLGVGDAVEHSKRLYNLLFPEQAQRDLVGQAQEAARELGMPLRLRITVDAGARELHCLPWELLTQGTPAENPLSFESTYIVRYAAADTRSWRHIQHRPKAPLKALLATGLTDWFDASIPPAGTADLALQELNRASDLLKACGAETAAVRGYLNPETFKSELEATAGDILYLCVDVPAEPGSGNGGCPGVDGWCSRLRDLPLAKAIRGLDVPPRLVVLSPIVRGDPSASAGVSGWLSILREAYELAQAGVIGVLTAQGPIASATWQTFVETFFHKLAVDGRMDLALHAARMAISDSGQQWVPVLISGLRTARIWYVPRFTEETKVEPAWKTLLMRIKKGECTPILGPGLNSTVARSRSEIALSWAESYRYPMAFHERVSLPQVGQYVASEYGEDFFYEQYEARLREFVLKRFGLRLGTEARDFDVDRLLTEVAMITLQSDPDEPHNILAALPFPLYVTASLNSFLSAALQRVPGKAPQEAIFGLANAPGTGQISTEPSPAQPLVYHLFGRLTDLRSSVLTEDNYFDFLIHFWKDREAVPKMVRAALTESSLLFLGFRMHHWDFRVLFRSLLAQEGSRRRAKHMHVAVQLDPDDDQVVDPERARDYLENYFSEFADADINVYWGSAEDFLLELKRRWDGFKG